MDDEQIVRMVEQSMALFNTVPITVADAEKVAQVKQVVAALANALIDLNQKNKAQTEKASPGGAS